MEPFRHFARADACATAGLDRARRSKRHPCADRSGPADPQLRAGTSRRVEPAFSSTKRATLARFVFVACRRDILDDWREKRGFDDAGCARSPLRARDPLTQRRSRVQASCLRTLRAPALARALSSAWTG